MAIDLPLPWHAESWQQLASQRRHQRLAHAYLLSGLPGSGRYQFALALAASMLCEQPDSEAYACGRCRQCLLFESGNHPDVLDIAPEEGKTSIRIDQIRQISQRVNQTSNQSGATKVIIIRPAEALGQAAANALLKNLEEPPGKTLFLLLSEPAAQMLPTIRSRCQPLPLGIADHKQSLDWLRQHSAAAEDELKAALALSPGAPMTALSLLEQGIPAWRSIVHEQLEQLEQGSLTPLAVAKYCHGQPTAYAIQLMHEHVLVRLRQALLTANHALGRALLAFERDLVQTHAQLVSGANPNALMALEHIFIAWQQAAGDKDVAAPGSDQHRPVRHTTSSLR